MTLMSLGERHTENDISSASKAAWIVSKLLRRSKRKRENRKTVWKEPNLVCA